MSTGKNKSTPKEVVRMKNSLKLAKTIKTYEPDSKQCGKTSKTLHKEKDTKANKNVNQATAPLTSLTKSKQDLHDSKLSLAPKTLPPTRPEDFSSNWKKMQSVSIEHRTLFLGDSYIYRFSGNIGLFTFSILFIIIWLLCVLSTTY